MELREYQKQAIQALPHHYDIGSRVVLVSPTGSGKTVMGAGFVAQGRARRILWVAHRWELLRHARKELIRMGIRECSIGMLCGKEAKSNVLDAPIIRTDLASTGVWPPTQDVVSGTRVQLATIDWLRGCRLPIPGLDLIVIDEAHRSESMSYKELVESHRDVPVLGMTATPVRLDGKPLRDTFDGLLKASGPTQLEAGGYIAAPVTYGVTKERAGELVKGLKTRKGDYMPKQLGREMTRPGRVDEVVREWKRLGRGNQTIVFASSREHARQLTVAFRTVEPRVEYLDGLTPEAKRRGILQRLENGQTRIVVNVDVLTEGFDCPAVKCISLVRPTKSLTRYLQYCGRAARPYGDERPRILDHVGNCWRHGLPNIERHWSLDGHEGRHGPPPVKRCPECEAMISAGYHECPECGAEQPLSEEEEAESQAELERIRMEEKERQRKRKVLERLAKSRKLPDADKWVERALEQVS